MKDWEAIKSGVNVSKIETFAESVKKLGEEFNLEYLSNYGEKLYQNAISFDMENLSETIKHFPVLVEKISSLV